MINKLFCEDKKEYDKALDKISKMGTPQLFSVPVNYINMITPTESLDRDNIEQKKIEYNRGDTKKPIILSKYKDDLVVLDGHHRLQAQIELYGEGCKVEAIVNKEYVSPIITPSANYIGIIPIDWQSTRDMTRNQ